MCIQQRLGGAPSLCQCGDGKLSDDLCDRAVQLPDLIKCDNVELGIVLSQVGEGNSGCRLTGAEHLLDLIVNANCNDQIAGWFPTESDKKRVAQRIIIRDPIQGAKSILAADIRRGNAMGESGHGGGQGGDAVRVAIDYAEDQRIAAPGTAEKRIIAITAAPGRAERSSIPLPPFSNSGTYRCPHRMLVGCAMSIPRSALIARKSR